MNEIKIHFKTCKVFFFFDKLVNLKSLLIQNPTCLYIIEYVTTKLLNLQKLFKERFLLFIFKSFLEIGVRVFFKWVNTIKSFFGGKEVCYWYKSELIIRVRGDWMSFVLGLVQNGKLRGFAYSKDDASIYLINF